jgi:DNA gyrase inhibitor GyrI
VTDYRQTPVATRTIAAFPALMLNTHGPYWKLSGTFKRLNVWMEGAGIEAAGPAVALFYDDPTVTPPEQTRYSICYPLDEHGAVKTAEALRGGTPVLESAPAAPPEPAAPPTPATPAEPDSLSVERFEETSVAALEYEGPAADSPRVYEALAAWVQARGLTPLGPPREVYLAEPGTLEEGLMHAEVQQPVSMDEGD